MSEIQILLISAGAPLFIFFIYLWKKGRPLYPDKFRPVPGKSQEVPSLHTPSDVEEFYDKQTDNFLKVYGEVIQAFRTKDIANLLDYQIDSIGLKGGMQVLDAGCGVCGPAVYFAEKTGVHIDAVTISGVQAEIAKKKIEAKGLSGKVHVHHGDYHRLQDIFTDNKFDVVYFLESWGHSTDKAKAIDSAWQVLRPGGLLYIKDLFTKEPLTPVQKPFIDRELTRINSAYRYQVADLYPVLEYLRKKGWILSELKTVDIPLDDFENLSISNDFQELTGIGKIDNWGDYVFPVEFFELKCTKPELDNFTGNSRYFLQNLFYKRVMGLSAEEIKFKKMDPGSLGRSNG